MNLNTIYQGDALPVLRMFPEGSVHCCVTSPPYWGLRDYGTAEWEGGSVECDHKMPRSTNRHRPGDKSTTNKGSDPITWQVCAKCGATRIDSQLGLEKTPEEYISKLVEIFREVRRVLRKDGTCWVVIGDSYAGGNYRGGGIDTASWKQRSNAGTVCFMATKKNIAPGLKPKELVGIPWRLAFALQADGWWLRQDIIWSKPNPMPESVRDRCTKSHEYIFLLTKSAKYWYDAEAIKEEASQTTLERNKYEFKGAFKGQFSGTPNEKRWQEGRPIENPMFAADKKANKRSVWHVATAPYPEAHFACFAPKLIEPCILAGCPEGGIVLDPFMGSGTTGFVAVEQGRKYVGIELNPEYIEMAKRRIAKASRQRRLF